MTARTQTRPLANEFAEYYGRYIELVPDGDVLASLEKQRKETVKLLGGLSEAKGGHRYAPDKWSIKGVLGHVTDAERVFAYRALSIGRGDPTPLPGFDEKTWADGAKFHRQALKDLVRDYEMVRDTTLSLLRSLPEEAWLRRGTASNWPVTVRALAWIIAGHERHHMKILKERYL
jgi:uncharacterized damage-inducible protein DinB